MNIHYLLPLFSCLFHVSSFNVHASKIAAASFITSVGICFCSFLVWNAVANYFFSCTFYELVKKMRKI